MPDGGCALSGLKIPLYQSHSISISISISDVAAGFLTTHPG